MIFLPLKSIKFQQKLAHLTELVNIIEHIGDFGAIFYKN